MSETYKKEIVQHIKKQIETEFNIKLRHGALYPALNALEQRGFLESKKQKKDGRSRKVYAITENGKIYLQTYYSILQGQLGCKETETR